MRSTASDGDTGRMHWENEAVTPEEIQRAAEGLADTLASIEAGALDVSPAQGAYLAGAHHALRAVLDDIEIAL